MSEIADPGRFSVILHEFFWLVLSKKYYREYVQSFALNGNEKVLDFGCGPGAASVHIAPIIEKEGGELTCFDLSQTWIDQTKKHLKEYANVRYFAEDIVGGSLENDYFDAVNLHFMLHDTDKEKRPVIVNTIAAKMKTGGRLFIREPVKDGHGMPPDEIRELMESAGLYESDFEIKKGKMGLNYSGIFIKKKWAVQ